MALTTSTIIGRVPLPNDAAPIRAEVEFTLSGFDTEGADVVTPARIVAPLTATGELPAGFKLWRNTGGLRGTVYGVTVRWSEADRARGAVLREAMLRWVQIGSASTYTLPALLANPATAAPGIYQTMPDAEWQAIKDRLGVVEAPGWVTPPRLSDAVLGMFGGQGYSGVWAPSAVFPGGAGVVAGQTWIVTAAGSHGGQAFTVGDRLVAVINNPSTTVYAGNWLRIRQYDLVGVVSQAGGIPTGAIMERGSNANGNYTKFADGTMICHRSSTGLPAPDTAYGAVFAGAELEWTFPAAFIVAPSCSAGVRSSGTRWAHARPVSQTAARIRNFSALSTADASSWDAVAIGRWI